MRKLWLGVLGLVLVAAVVACEKKRDPAVANAGGGASTQRHIVTLQGAPR